MARSAHTVTTKDFSILVRGRRLPGLLKKLTYSEEVAEATVSRWHRAELAARSSARSDAERLNKYVNGLLLLLKRLEEKGS